MNQKTKNILLLVLCGGFLLFLGYTFRRKEEVIKQEVTQVAVNEAIDYVKDDLQVTKNFFNSIGNYWKQVWK